LKKRFVTLALVLALVVALVIPASVALAATEGTVDCTVSGKLISVSVTDGDVSYGVLAVGATEDTTASGVNETQTALNDGTVAEDFDIKSSHAVGGTQWSLAATAGSDAFTHTASIDGGTTWPVAMTVADTYVALDTNVAAAGSQTFDLQIEMPTSITDYSAKAITVTVLATES